MDCVRGLVLSCLFISACFAMSGETTDDGEDNAETVTRGREQETEGRRDNGEEKMTDERGGDGLAARTRTRLGMCPSDLKLSKAGEACEELMSSSGCESRALALEFRLRQAGEQVLEGEREGANTNGGGRRKLTGGPTRGLPPVPSCVVVERRAAG